MSFWKKSILILVMALLATLGGLNQRAMNTLRSERNLTRQDPLENAPPLLAFTTVALGGFRGVIANILWMRAVRLQDEGRYFEMVLLADWISKLQPYFGSVWTHQAWNLAYNISREFQDPHERWLWVQSAIRLLRDEGLRYNPTDPLIYQDLAWLFHHKMGENLDDAHWTYKQSWALPMNQIISHPPDWESLIHPPDEAWQARATRLREEFKLDPALMREVDEKYGPLDWRLVDSHALYWGYLGLQKTEGQANRIVLHRAIWQSLLQAFRKGRVIANLADQEIDFGPNLDIGPTVERTMLEMMELEPDQVGYIRKAHRGFLIDATFFNYTHNRVEEAAQWFAKLQALYPESLEEGEGLNEFAIRRISEDLDRNRVRARLIVEGILVNFFYNLAIGEDDQADGFHRLAQQVYAKYAANIEGQEERLGQQSFEGMKLDLLKQILVSHPKFSEALQLQLMTRLGISREDVIPPDSSGENTSSEKP